MEDNKVSTDSIWIEKNSKGYTYGVKVYKEPLDTIDTLRTRLQDHIKWLNDNYNEVKKEGV